jgi:hypothetical protein
MSHFSNTCLAAESVFDFGFSFDFGFGFGFGFGLGLGLGRNPGSQPRKTGTTTCLINTLTAFLRLLSLPVRSLTCLSAAPKLTPVLVPLSSASVSNLTNHQDDTLNPAAIFQEHQNPTRTRNRI